MKVYDYGFDGTRTYYKATVCNWSKYTFRLLKRDIEGVNDCSTGSLIGVVGALVGEVGWLRLANQSTTKN